MAVARLSSSWLRGGTGYGHSHGMLPSSTWGAEEGLPDQQIRDETLQSRQGEIHLQTDPHDVC